MRILHEVHELVTPYSPQIFFQEERMAKLYSSFSPQEYKCLKNALGLLSVNRTLDLEKAMRMLQWFKQSTCQCIQHAVRRGGKLWQLRPSNAVPTDVVLQLPTTGNSKILQSRKAGQKANPIYLMIPVPSAVVRLYSKMNQGNLKMSFLSLMMSLTKRWKRRSKTLPSSNCFPVRVCLLNCVSFF